MSFMCVGKKGDSSDPRFPDQNIRMNFVRNRCIRCEELLLYTSCTAVSNGRREETVAKRSSKCLSLVADRLSYPSFHSSLSSTQTTVSRQLTHCMTV